MAEFTNTQLDRYKLQERLGAGGMARVYKAWDTNLERAVAIKILHDHLAEDPNFKERFEREAKLIASLNHPNIVQVYDFKATERGEFPLYYMVMSYIRGQTLRQVLADHAEKGELMGYEQVLSIMLTLCDALKYAHSTGMVHRDVKPANIMLNESGHAILMDFGVARLVISSRLTQEGSSTGTPTYMSPEQAQGQPGDARSDLYSLGVILFEMLTGTTPYSDEGGILMMLKHVHEPVPSISEFMATANPNLDNFIYRALAKDPNDRFQTAEEFAENLKLTFVGNLVESTPEMQLVSARRTGEVKRSTASSSQIVVTSPSSGRRRIIAAIIGVVVLAAVAVGAALFLNQPDANPTHAQTALIDGSNEDSNVPSMTGNLYFSSNFEADDEYLASWPQISMDGFSQEVTPDGVYRLHSERPRTASTSIFDPAYKYRTVAISMSGTLTEDSNAAAAFGIVFRYVDEDQYHVFAVDGMGRYSIWQRADGEWIELRQAEENWTPDERVNPRGELNRLMIDLLGNRITGKVNGEQVFQIRDDTLSAGNIGIYVATHTEGTATALIESYQVMPASPPSMTDG